MHKISAHTICIWPGPCSSHTQDTTATTYQALTPCQAPCEQDDQSSRFAQDCPHFSSLKILHRGFPGGAAVESPPADAGDTGSCPGPGRSHMLRSGWARDPWPLSLRVRSLCSATGEATTVRGSRTTKKKKKRTNFHQLFLLYLLLLYISMTHF